MPSLNLATIRSPREHVDRVYQPDAVAADDHSFTIAAPVALSFDVEKAKDQFRLAGRVQTALELTCSRCLEPFVWPMEALFDLSYQPRAGFAAVGERQIDEEDFSTALYDNDEIDLGQLMAERLYLALPMKPLCRDDCRGLCSQCGTNLNRGSCSCPRAWEDPRLAALKAINLSIDREP